MQARLLRVAERKQQIGTKHQRKLQKYSDNFIKMFSFFLKGYRSGLLDFCGSDVRVRKNKTGPDSMFGFRMYDNGQFSKKEIESSQPNVLRAVIIGKKSWGLWVDEWSDGIVEGSFTIKEILGEFDSKGIEIPESLKKDFNDRIWKKLQKKVRRNP